jgi:hypothetical protein
MTGNATMDKERLAAFADGELTPEEAAEVAIYLADHPQDQAWVDELMASNVQLRRAFDGIAQEPVPDRFTNLILPEAAAPAPKGNVVMFRRKMTPARAGAAGAALALAAALTAMAFLPGGTGNPLLIGPVTPGSPLHAALDALPTGQTQPFADAGDLTVVASLPADGTVCREFELAQPAAQQLQLGIACRRDAGWSVEFVLAEAATPPEGSTDYVPAFGPEAQAVETWLDSRGAGMALSAEEEAAWMARGWAPQANQ